jgi:ABC-type glycerol-3-phosphate transport system substrate-binding protein
MIDSEGGLAAAEFLLALMACSPPDILNMSWYERVRAYASGKVAMAYGYTLLAPYFETRRPLAGARPHRLSAASGGPGRAAGRAGRRLRHRHSGQSCPRSGSPPPRRR